MVIQAVASASPAFEAVSGRESGHVGIGLFLSLL